MSKSAFPGLKSFKPKKAVAWWFFKKSMMTTIKRGFLVLSAAAAAVGMVFWLRPGNSVSREYIIGGAVVGLLILLLALRSLIKFKATVIRAVLIILVSGAYLASSLYYILNRGA